MSEIDEENLVTGDKAADETQELAEQNLSQENNEASTSPEEPSEATTTPKIFCAKCGTELAEGTVYCPKCGHKVGEKLEESQTDTSNDDGTSTKKKKKGLLWLIIGIAIAIAGVCVFFVVRGVQAKEVVLNKDELTIKAGETGSLKYTINPDNTKDKTVTWSTSNDTIATVDKGTVSAKNEGTCTITVKTSNGKTDTCDITVTPAGPDLAAIFKKYCSSDYASVASDGSYLSIDTNPNDYDDYTDYDAYRAILSVNDALELPESVVEKMNQTRSIDGMQTYESEDIEVSWSYHPDNGLEVIYSLKNN